MWIKLIFFSELVLDTVVTVVVMDNWGKQLANKLNVRPRYCIDLRSYAYKKTFYCVCPMFLKRAHFSSDCRNVNNWIWMIFDDLKVSASDFFIFKLVIYFVFNFRISPEFLHDVVRFNQIFFILYFQAVDLPGWTLMKPIWKIFRNYSVRFLSRWYWYCILECLRSI